MRYVVGLLTLIAMLWSPGQSSAQDAPPASAVQPGEHLTYEISWLNILAGTAVMDVMNAQGSEGNPALTLVTTARSSPKVTIFYPVDNRVESLVDPRSFQSEKMTFRRREGKRKNDFDYTFHHQEGTVTAVKDGVSETLAIPPGTLDAISCLYYVRSMLPLKPGVSQSLNVHHDKKNYKLEVRVEGMETIEGSWGKREAARLLVIMPFQGIFLNQGNIRVWLANDSRRIPLRMKAKVIIGSIVADLVSGFPGTVLQQ
ncbi:MAG TPA: DUF3108 domain-containing protein [Nitrospira sp.]|nr:DUF3108 domain-containing protein [Nitrospira sp.]